MLFVLLRLLRTLHASTHEEFRRGLLKDTLLIIIAGIVGFLLPIYPILRSLLVGYFAYELTKRRPRIPTKQLLIALPLVLISPIDDFDAITYFIPQSYHLIHRGGLRTTTGIAEPQNPGMSSIAAFLLLPDVLLGTDPSLYVFALRLFNAVVLAALLCMLGDEFLVYFLSLPVALFYFAFKPSYADLAVALAGLAFFRSIYYKDDDPGRYLAVLMLIKYVRPFMLAALLVGIIDRRLFLIIPIVFLARFDILAAIYVALLLPAARKIQASLGDFLNLRRSPRMLIVYVRRIRETILFGRIFGVYGSYGLIANRGYRPERMQQVLPHLTQVRQVVSQEYFVYLATASVGVALFGFLSSFAAPHAFYSARDAYPYEAFLIVSGAIQMAVTGSVISRQYLYMFVALSAAFLRDRRYMPAAFFSLGYAFAVLWKSGTVGFLQFGDFGYRLVFIIVLTTFFILDRVKLPNVNLKPFAIIAVIATIAIQRASVIHYSADLSIYDIIRNEYPEGSLVLSPGILRGFGTYLDGYVLLNVFDPSCRYKYREVFTDEQSAIEFLTSRPSTIMVTTLKDPTRTEIIAEAFYVLPVAILLASSTVHIYNTRAIIELNEINLEGPVIALINTGNYTIAYIGNQALVGPLESRLPNNFVLGLLKKPDKVILYYGTKTLTAAIKKMGVLYYVSSSEVPLKADIVYGNKTITLTFLRAFS